MTKRITDKNLEALARLINEKLGKPIEPWAKDKTGAIRSSVGCYHLEWAYGGVTLSRIVNESGAVSRVFSGYETKRTLYEKMSAFLLGLETK